ncbi:MAG: hypothetical protein HC831_16450 [Chloroflexia bacterium]|nr:hypothetical protein [Chloroflexia bacterium]
MKFRLLTVIIIIIFVFGCTHNKFDVDVSNISVTIDVKRFDLDLMKNYPDTPDVYKLIEDYNSFLDLYSYQILQIGGPNQRDYPKLLLDFTKYCQDYQIPAKVEKEFGDFSKQKKELEKAFKYYKYYFPSKQVPKVYTYFSNFSQSVIT